VIFEGEKVTELLREYGTADLISFRASINFNNQPLKAETTLARQSP
jgi:hypothetical protein